MAIPSRFCWILVCAFLFACTDSHRADTPDDTGNTGRPSDTETTTDTENDTDTSPITDTETDSTTPPDTGIDPSGPAIPRIDGFFVQPSLGYGATDYQTFNTQGEYTAWVQNIANAGATMLFYQWTVHYAHEQTWFSNAYGGSASADFAYYNPTPNTLNGVPVRGWITPTSWPGAPLTGGKEPVEYLLDAGAAAGVDIWLGLYLNESPNSLNWWQAVSDTVIDTTDLEIIEHHVQRSIATVNDLYDQYGGHPALGGFYYSVEVANIAFVPELNRPVLADLLDRVARAVHDRDPSLRLAISPFFNTTLASPEVVGDMWEYALQNAALDIVILQDGVGVDPFTLTDTTDLITPYFREIARATTAAGKELWGNVELFTNRGTRMTPDFVPGDIQQIVRQLETAAPFVTRFVCFGFQYMDPEPRYVFSPPLGGSAETDAGLRRTLYDDYLIYLEGL